MNKDNLKVAVLAMQKNEGQYLNLWFKYYSELFGISSLFLFDNGSDDPETNRILNNIEELGLEINRDYSTSIDFERKGEILFLKAIELFDSGYDFVYFADIDEFLIVCNDTTRYIFDKETIVEHFFELMSASESIFRISTSYFNVPNKKTGYIDNTYAKKIILRNDCNRSMKLDLGFHLWDWSKQKNICTWGEIKKTNFGYIHLHNKSYEEKTKRSKEKLKSRVKNFEESTLMNYKGDGAHLIGDLRKNKYEYYSSFLSMNQNVSLDQFYDYIGFDSAITEKISFDEPDSSVAISAEKLCDKAFAYRADELFFEAIEVFAQGMKEYPSQLDQYGHPTFKKELMRTWLYQQKWEDANKFIPNKNDVGGGDWHKILFARAYAAINDTINAKLWWSRVIEQDPDNTEAKNFFMALGDKLQTLGKDVVRTWDMQDILSQPSMEKAGVALLETHLRKCQTFLEYGAGGSTVFAAELGVKNIHSVESDKNFLDAVQKKVLSIYPNTKTYAHFVDIGKTKDWGAPINKENADGWPKYCVAPWQAIFENNQSPNLILIDGRFRVACFLACLILAKHRTIILFDDYTNRSEYHIVEKYLHPNKTSGRMAKFIVNKNFSVSEILLDLMLYATNPA